MNSYQRQAELHRALAHPVRLQILEILSREEACVCHLTAILGKPQPYVSQQLSLLKEANLIADRREGTLVYYRLQNEQLATLLAAAQSTAGSESDLDGGSQRLTAVFRRPVPGCPCPHCQQAETLMHEADALAAASTTGSEAGAA